MAGSRIQRFVRLALAWLAATVTTAGLSAVVQTQHTVAGLRGSGLPVSVGERLQMTGQDLLGFAPTYAAIVGAGFLIAFLVTAGLLRLRPWPRGPLHALAGAVAVLTALLLMNTLLGLALIPATLSLPWLLTLGICGGIGGSLYGRLTG